nr:retrovirus-related Pol polyprotein from transposon TNT 1-94 [Tanacetum cinerariifolium]GEX75438.1 retrovirus-related Pol polyprotein from transposon TNT 1-94 [Tanacetum cinerariifolium]
MIHGLWILDKFELHVHIFLKILLPNLALLLVSDLVLKLPGGDKLVSWSSKKQDCTSMSSAEAEYVSLSACCAQVLRLRTQLIDYGFHFDKIQKVKKCSIVELFFVGTEYQLADLFTKALPEDRFKYLVRRLGMRCFTPEELEVLANESA